MRIFSNIDIRPEGLLSRAARSEQLNFRHVTNVIEEAGAARPGGPAAIREQPGTTLLAVSFEFGANTYLAGHYLENSAASRFRLSCRKGCVDFRPARNNG